MRREARALGTLMAGFSGALAVQVGAAELDYLRATRHMDRIRLDGESAAASLRARAQALPLAGDCADLVVLVHVLEGSPVPAAILAECARILRGEGKLVIVSRRRLAPAAWASWPAALLGRDRLLGCRRLRSLIEEAGLVWRGGAGFAPGAWVRRRSARCPWLGAFSFAALAVKRIAGLTVLRPEWSSGRVRRRGRALQGQGHAS